MRDMTRKQFQARLKRYGFTPQLFGYYDLGIDGRAVHVDAPNGGPKRRDQLAYLFSARARENAQ